MSETIPCKVEHCSTWLDSDWKYCSHCGHDQSKDPSEKPFCVVEIPNAETAAVVRAVVNSHLGLWGSGRDDAICRNFPGGREAFEKSGDGKGGYGKSNLYCFLDDALEAAGITKDKAPWLEPPKPKVPKNVGCREVLKTEDGYSFDSGSGSIYSLSWGQLEAMLAEKPDG